MKNKLHLILLLQFFFFLGFAQNKTISNTGTAVSTQKIEPTDPCEDCPQGYQWNLDSDGDGYGDPNVYVYAATKPNHYVANQSDCDDSNPNITTANNIIWYRDVDGDGHGAINGATTTSCLQPTGYAGNNDDINDGNFNITNIIPQTFYYDNDGDGFGNPNISIYYSVKPTNYVTNNSDYDDDKALITNIPPQMYYYDFDGDGFGDPNVSVYQSNPPIKYVNNNTDCNITNPSVNPNTKWYADFDQDGLGDPSVFIQQCINTGSNYVLDSSDNCPTVYGTNADCSAVPAYDLNYIIISKYKKPTTTTFVNPAADKAQTNITYFDGIGRPVQQIANQYSATGKDIITHIAYDDFGRQVKEYLPYASSQTNLNYMVPYFLESELTNQYKTNYGVTNSNPFSEKQLESSPLNRVLKQASPGNDWKLGSGHEIKMDYQTNSADEVIYYYAVTTWDSSLGVANIDLNTGTYTANQLFKIVTYDENTSASPTETAGSVVEFKNKEGQVVLKRTYGTVGTGTSNEKYDTYYVYDVYGNLTYVIPPKAADLIAGSASLQANLTSTSEVTSGNSLNLKATNSITLLPGFRAYSGSTFSASIASSSDKQTVLNNLSYQYKYDQRNRLVEKKLPGKQWEFIVYDKLDRIVATGPVNSPFVDVTATGWLITKYDTFDRPVYTGWMNSTPATSAGRATLQNNQNSAALIQLNESKQTTGNIDGFDVYYTNLISPTTFKLLTVNYYDNYTFPSNPVITIPTSVETQTTLTTAQVKGLATASWTRVLSDYNINLGETKATFYDIKGRPVRTYAQNFLGGYTCTDSKLDEFSGQLKYSITKHKRDANSTELVTKDIFDYSAQDRLLTQTHQINGAEPAEVILTNTYNELGQLISKKIGGNTQNINYSYNIRGWLTDINDITSLTKVNDPKDLFAFKINYNNPATGIANVKPLYNGNISETQWATNSDNGVLRSYGYKYDNLNRLKEGVYKKGSQLDAYNETLWYDKNGNITGLTRNGNNDTTVQQIDNLAYTYNNSNNSNQLVKVVDSAPINYKANGFIDSAANTVDDYSYDAYGNMTKDNNKNITDIKYNHLNLPVKITFATTGNIVYIYDADGKKVQKIVNEVSKPKVTTEYIDAYQYENGLLKFFVTTEGYVENISGTYKYMYVYKDHLNNTRLSYDKNLAIKEENNYYPFGLKQEGYNYIKSGIDKYKYNGKEFQDELQFNVYDYGARNYDPAIARWMSMDTLSEKYIHISPYAYVANNPTIFIDPDGKQIIFAKNATEKFKKNFAQAIAYLKANKMDGLFAKLQASDVVYTIEQGSNLSFFDPSNNTITWDDENGIITSENEILSPTTLLNHEADHALEEEKHPIKKMFARYFPSRYENREEKRVITGTELRTARALGEIKKKNGITRTDHKGFRLRTKSSTSNIPVKAPTHMPAKT
ncbi:DUF6443 domain-containing protein [Flavobacterium sp. UBA7680]|uniref:DUF6443 domain-containing protein n=1 Tax=Flavobacterium sp. UBA7680 TaxID=1946559 RepID=UPI0025B99910|nr:DUF6443 domain-containing protein [Flavobacterium sp. UBA7680]